MAAWVTDAIPADLDSDVAAHLKADRSANHRDLFHPCHSLGGDLAVTLSHSLSYPGLMRFALLPFLRNR